MGGILWIIIVGFVAGLIARWLSPGPNNPTGFILTVVLGIAGAFLATFIGQTIGWYSPNQGAGFITATPASLHALSTSAICQSAFGLARILSIASPMPKQSEACFAYPSTTLAALSGSSSPKARW